MLSNTTLVASAALLSLASAVTHIVDVGKNGLAFTPGSTVAAVGDIVEFHFFPKNHTVTQTGFSAPCQANLNNGFFSGFMPTSSGEAPQIFQVTVSSTAPIWFYCSQGKHCEAGMVGVINEPASGNTLAVFAANAAKAGNSTIPSTIGGGAIVANTDSNSTSTMSSAPSSTATDIYGNPIYTSTSALSPSSAPSSFVPSSSAPSSTSASASASATVKTSGAVSLQVVKWSELLDMAILICGAALVMY